MPARLRERSPIWRDSSASPLRSSPLLNLGHQGDAVEARAGEPTHHLHDGTIIYVAITTDVDPLVGTAPRVRDSPELGQQFVERYLGVLQEHLPLEIDRNCERFAVLVKALGLGLRQIERHADSEQRGRDHKNDQEHKHDVDHRRHVDFAHDATAPPLTATGLGRTRRIHRHGSPLTPARRSAATGSRRIRRRSPPVAAPACSPRTRIYYRKSSPVWRRRAQLRSQKVLPRCRGQPPRARYFLTPRWTESSS